jgi:hypothetical protein
MHVECVSISRPRPNTRGWWPLLTSSGPYRFQHFCEVITNEATRTFDPVVFGAFGKRPVLCSVKSITELRI